LKKILVYRGKNDNLYWDVTTKELENEAKQKLFKWLDKEFSFFEDGCVSKILLERSRAGDIQAITRVLYEIQNMENGA